MFCAKTIHNSKTKVNIRELSNGVEWSHNEEYHTFNDLTEKTNLTS